jgi:hypothetical protein
MTEATMTNQPQKAEPVEFVGPTLQKPGSPD